MSEDFPKYFRGQHQGEKFITFFRHHWFYLLKDFVYFILMISGTVLVLTNFGMIRALLVGSTAMKMLFLIVFSVATIYLHRFFYKVFTLFLDTGIITDIRIIDHQKTLLFRDTMDSVDMAQIQNLEKVEEGILPKILNYGHLKIFLTASSSIKTFHDVPNAAYYFKLLNTLKENRQYKLIREHGGTNIPIETQADDEALEASETSTGYLHYRS